MEPVVKVFDCSMRDGGYVNNWRFSREQARDCYTAALQTGMHYCEVGFRRAPVQNPGAFGAWYFATEELITNTFSDLVHDSCALAIMAQVGTFTISDFVPRERSLVKMVRLLIAYHCKDKDDTVLDTAVVKETVQLSEALSEMGYETSINIGRVDKLSEAQIETICALLSGAPIAYLYLADTYGNLGIHKMQKVLAMFTKYHIGPLGFHAHDNLQNASIKSIDALYHGASIVDVTFGGFGRGSGNAKAELVIAHMIMGGRAGYDLLPALHYTDKYVQPYRQGNLLYLITGMYSMHVNYAIELIDKDHGLSVQDAYEVLIAIKSENKHHFFNADVLLQAISNLKAHVAAA